MPRKVRIEYPGAIYHVMSRGDRREDIFVDDEDRQRFLSTLGEACQKTEWQVHAYCLMRNHFHLVIETPQANLVAGMKWHLGVYTKRFNIRHKLCGHLFAGRYKALVVEGSGNGYLRTVCDYVHLNPVRAKLIKPKGVFGKLCLEQLWRISQASPAKATLVACRSAFGRERNSQGQRGWPEAIRAGDGAAAAGGGQSGSSGDSGWVVFGVG